MSATEAAARAPGKLFLSGEYVVLMGAPAVIAAIDRYAEVRVTLGEKPGPLVVRSLAEGTSWEAPVARNEMPGGDAGVVLAALRAAARRPPGGGLDGRAGADGAPPRALRRGGGARAAQSRPAPRAGAPGRRRDRARRRAGAGGRRRPLGGSPRAAGLGGGHPDRHSGARASRGRGTAGGSGREAFGRRRGRLRHRARGLGRAGGARADRPAGGRPRGAAGRHRNPGGGAQLRRSTTPK